MPRLPVDGKKVIEHRITLGTKERQLLEGALNAYRVDAAVEPILNVITDPKAMYTLGMAYEVVTGKDLPGILSPADLEQTLQAFKNEVRELQSKTDLIPILDVEDVGGWGGLLKLLLEAVNPLD